MKQLYQDESVQLTDKQIVIRKHYFPFQNAKTILYDDIRDIHIRTDTQVLPEWGLHSSDPEKWFNKDDHRQSKLEYIELTLKDQETKPCFSPSNCQQVYKIIENQIQNTNVFKERDMNIPVSKPKKENQKENQDNGQILNLLPQLKTNADLNLFSF